MPHSVVCLLEIPQPISYYSTTLNDNHLSVFGEPTSSSASRNRIFFHLGAFMVPGEMGTTNGMCMTGRLETAIQLLLVPLSDVSTFCGDSRPRNSLVYFGGQISYLTHSPSAAE